MKKKTLYLSTMSITSETLYKLGEKLSAAIEAGDAKEAASLVAQFSDMKLKLDINIKKEELDQRNKDQEFSVRVHVEDRLSDGFYFNLQVKSSDTIQDLKRKVMLKYNFPEEVQRWIIGKKIPENENKLSQCSVKGPGHTLYLYLVTARSVGLNKQDYETRQQALHLGILIPQKQVTQAGLQSPVQTESPESFYPVQHLPLGTLSSSSSNNSSPVSSASPVLGMEEIGIGHHSYGPARQTSRRSLSSGGSNMLQEMLMAPNLSSLSTLDSRQKSTSFENAAKGMEPHWYNDFIKAGVTMPTSVYRTLSTMSHKENEKIGWECTKCTFINLPMRPGCEMCTNPKPSGYIVPSGYVMTAEERMLLENDQLLERMTREAEPAVKHKMVPRAPPRARMYEQLSENIQLIDTFNSQISSSNQDIHDNNQIIGNDLIFVPEGADWVHAQEVPMRASPSFEPRHESPNPRSRSSLKKGSIAAPPSMDNQQQMRITQALGHSPNVSRRDSRFHREPSHDS